MQGTETKSVRSRQAVKTSLRFTFTSTITLTSTTRLRQDVYRFPVSLLSVLYS
jgi:hypothetical protein